VNVESIRGRQYEISKALVEVLYGLIRKLDFPPSSQQSNPPAASEKSVITGQTQGYSKPDQPDLAKDEEKD